MSRFSSRPARLLGVAAPLTLAAALLPAAHGASAASAAPDAGTALFTSAPAAPGRQLAAHPESTRSRLVTLRTSSLPRRAAGQRIALPLYPGVSETATVTNVEHHRDYTAWSGPLDAPLGSFTMVKVGRVYRGDVSSPQGTYLVTKEVGSRYWVTTVPQFSGPSADDVLTRGGSGGARPERPLAHPRTDARSHHLTKVDVTFGYTTRAEKLAGGKGKIRAAAALAAADTNHALADSHLKIRIRVDGIVHTKSRETTNVFTDLKRLARPHDGHFDNLIAARGRHHADVVHLLTGGSRLKLCGAGYEPVNRRSARPVLGASVSFESCLPYIVATHELGHNLGADHIKYHGISHDSKLPFAYGHYNVAQRYLSVMSYYDPCQDVGVYTCQRIPYYSSPTNKYHGLGLGDHHQDNTRAIRMIAPLVARYAHR